MFIDTRFPTSLSLGSSGGPMFSTAVIATLGGDEQRNRAWAYPRRCWQVGQVNRDETETRLLHAFFRAVAVGRLNTFRLRDPLPGEAVGYRETQLTGDGLTPFFTLVKTYTSGSQSVTRVITRLVTDTLIVYLNGTALSGSAYTTQTLDDQSIRVTLVTVPTAGQVITASYEFDCEVRFDSDRLPITRVAPNVYTWDSIKLWEERPAGANSDEAAPVVGPAAPVLSGDLVYVEDLPFYADLSWTAPASGDLPILGYLLYRRPGNGETEPVLALAATGTTRVYQDMTSSAEGYTYGVTAYTAREQSAMSNLVFLQQPDHVVPSLTARTVLGGAAGPNPVIRLGWGTPPPTGGETGPVNYYIYRRHPVTLVFTLYIIVDGGLTHILADDGIDQSNDCVYYATSVGWWGESAPSTHVTGHPGTLPPSGPDNPYDGN
jgi:uncharacterized protein (TIGR02217 family)